MNQTLFHPGERAAQAKAGLVPPTPAIRDWMPDQHRAFFGLLPFLPIATIDQRGAPVATFLTGAPGFITSPDRTTLHIAARPGHDDPVASSLLPGAPAGLLGIDLATRRRNRANGMVRSIGPAGLTVSVNQSFGNCPRYIQTRTWHDIRTRAWHDIQARTWHDIRTRAWHDIQARTWHDIQARTWHDIQARTWHDAATTPGPVERLGGLDPAARALIEGADTFFVATSSGSGAGAMGGVDISHRGGRPGFVATGSSGIGNETLTIPDFHGNRFFNTLGNLLMDPRAALLFVDWMSGSLLHLQGDVEILWDEDGGLTGAERLWRVSVTGGWRRAGAIPLRWVFQEYAPQLQRTGTWRDPARLP